MKKKMMTKLMKWYFVCLMKKNGCWREGVINQW